LTGRRSIWPVGDAGVGVIDQAALPFRYAERTLRSDADIAEAISTMVVRGAPLIGIAAAYGLALALRADPSDASARAAHARLLATRPTAVNLGWALDRVARTVAPLPPPERAAAAWDVACAMAEEDVAVNRAIGEHGAALIRDVFRRRQRRVNILTHCNAGRLAAVAHGTALAAIYRAHADGVPIHVWVDETRPRNQGLLTAWELADAAVSHALVADNAGGVLMQRGDVDLVVVGADRVSGAGDVCNKVGTYLKALAAFDCGVPFYAAVPSSTIDWALVDAQREITIEDRDPEELRVVSGILADGRVGAVRLASRETPTANPAFDVTPARFVSGIVTELGTFAPASLASQRARLEPAVGIRRSGNT